MSYSSSAALQLARLGSFLFIEQYHFDGSFLASTTPRRRLHYYFLWAQKKEAAMREQQIV